MAIYTACFNSLFFPIFQNFKGKCTGRKKCRSERSWLSKRVEANVCASMAPEVEFVSKSKETIRFNIDLNEEDNIDLKVNHFTKS